MLFTVRSGWQQFAVLALFTVAAVVCYAIGEREGAIMFGGFAGGSLTVSRDDKQYLGGVAEQKSETK